MLLKCQDVCIFYISFDIMETCEYLCLSVESTMPMITIMALASECIIYRQFTQAVIVLQLIE